MRVLVVEDEPSLSRQLARALSEAGLVSITVLLFCATCAPLVSNQPAQLLEVELDAFSGRPNPKWTLAPELSATLTNAFGSLTAAPDIGILDHLGYRGFVIRHDGREIRVYRGRIMITAQNRTDTFFDPASIEQQLAADARRRGFGDIVPR
jgi:hypothetical protein